MFLTILSLLALLVVAHGFLRVVRYFWQWLGYDVDLDRAVAGGYVSAEVALAAEGDKRALTAEQRRELALGRERMREEFLDRLRIGWYQVVFLFVIGTVARLLLAALWVLATAGVSQSRVGLVWGPFSPLYGCGTVLLTVATFLLRRNGARLWQVFLVSMLIGGALEQLTGWGMEALFRAQSWTYVYLPDHITQWVAWRFLVMWGLLGVVWTKFVMPWVLFRIGEPTTRRQVVFVTILAVYLALDIVMTLVCFGRAARRDAGEPPAGPVDQWVDEHYTDEFMSNKFQNLVIGRDL